MIKRWGGGWQTGGVIRRWAAVACVVGLTACRVDVVVDIRMIDNGSGEVTVTVDADAAVVNAAPGLADDVRTDDLIAAGWKIEGPSATTGGGLTMQLIHSFDTPAQATALLSTLNGSLGPLQSISVSRSATEDAITYTVTGTGRLDAGLTAFADPDLLAAVGATPYAQQIGEAGIAPSDAVGVELRVHLPGPIETTNGDVIDGGGSWTLPMDGTSATITATAVKSLERGGAWTAMSTIARLVQIAWIGLSLVAIALVVRRQLRRTRHFNAPR